MRSKPIAKPAQLLDQAVVSAAAADSALCADAVGDEFKHGFGVVIQTAHDGGVDGIGNAGAGEIALHLGKVCLAFLAEIIGNFGRSLGDFVILGTLAVEQAHGILFQTRQTGGAELLPVLSEIGAQRFIVFGAAGRAADGIQLQMHAGQAETVKHRLCQTNQLRVGNRRLRAEFLHTELVKFAQSACLRLFVAVAGHKVARLDRKPLVFERVLQHSSRCACGALGTQGHALAALGVEGVHFLLDDVGGLTHAARKQLGVLKHRCAHFAEAVGTAFLAHDIFNELPAVALLGQHVLCTLDFFGN